MEKKIAKQGQCGYFCIDFWLTGSCTKDCQYDYKSKLKLSKVEQKIERVPANLCATPFKRAIDEKIAEMNKRGFKFIPPMTIEEAKGSGEYAQSKTCSNVI